MSRLIAWHSYDTNSEPPGRCWIVDPKDTNGDLFTIKKAFFGHRHFIALSDQGRLYFSNLASYGNEVRPWFPVSLPEQEVIDADGGSDHYGYVTSDGNAYTWGKASMGCLGHSDQIERREPQKVKFFEDNNMKVVAIGTGGTYSWDGGFTLFLLDDNRLYYSGRLGGSDENTPVQVNCDDLKNRHILSISSGEDWAGIVVSRS